MNNIVRKGLQEIVITSLRFLTGGRDCLFTIMLESKLGKLKSLGKGAVLGGVLSFGVSGCVVSVPNAHPVRGFFNGLAYVAGTPEAQAQVKRQWAKDDAEASGRPFVPIQQSDIMQQGEFINIYSSSWNDRNNNGEIDIAPNDETTRKNIFNVGETVTIACLYNQPTDGTLVVETIGKKTGIDMKRELSIYSMSRFQKSAAFVTGGVTLNALPSDDYTIKCYLNGQLIKTFDMFVESRQ